MGKYNKFTHDSTQEYTRIYFENPRPNWENTYSIDKGS